jgi:hypothetical protein
MWTHLILSLGGRRGGVCGGEKKYLRAMSSRGGGNIVHSLDLSQGFGMERDVKLGHRDGKSPRRIPRYAPIGIVYVGIGQDVATRRGPDVVNGPPRGGGGGVRGLLDRRRRRRIGRVSRRGRGWTSISERTRVARFASAGCISGASLLLRWRTFVTVQVTRDDRTTALFFSYFCVGSVPCPLIPISLIKTCNIPT